MKITSIQIEINGETVSLSLEDAKALHGELRRVVVDRIVEGAFETRKDRLDLLRGDDELAQWLNDGKIFRPESWEGYEKPKSIKDSLYS